MITLKNKRANVGIFPHIQRTGVLKNQKYD